MKITMFIKMVVLILFLFIVENDGSMVIFIKNKDGEISMGVTIRLMKKRRIRGTLLRLRIKMKMMLIIMINSFNAFDQEIQIRGLLIGILKSVPVGAWKCNFLS